MKNIRHLILAALLAVAAGAAQGQLVTIGIQRRPIGELFEAIERQSPCRVFAPADRDLDSLYVTVATDSRTPEELVRLALKGTKFQVTAVEQSLFILKEKQLTTSLPVYFYAGGTETAANAEAEADSLAANFVLVDLASKGADSQVRLYEVGNPEDTGTGRVVLSGCVYDLRTGEAVPGVVLRIGETRISTITDNYGYYRFNLPRGRYEIHISGAGQAESRRQVQLHAQGTLDILSSEKVHTLTEIAVYGHRRDNVMQPIIGIERLRMQDIKNIPTAFGEADIMKIVTALPGVKAAGELSSGFNVRGGATDQNLILYNDGTIFNPTHLFGLFSAFNPDIVRDMELYKSSIPARFGGRISSVLDIHSREGNRKEFQGSASIGLLTSRLTVEGPVWKDRTSFIFGGRTTYSDWILKQIPEKSGYKNGNAGFYDLNGTISHRFNERNNLFVDGYYSRDNFRFEDYERYGYRNANASIKWRRIFNDHLLGVISAGYDHYEHNTENTENAAAAYSLDFGIDQLFGKADFSLQTESKHAFNFGADARHYDLRPGAYLPFGEQSIVATDRIQNEKALESAIYLSDKWTLSERLEIDYGIRWSIFNVLGPREYDRYNPNTLPSAESVIESRRENGVLKTYHGPELRLSARYSLGSNFSVKAGVNTMRQYIHKISNNTVMAPTDTWKLTDVNIAPQQGVQYAAGLYKDFPDEFVEISLEGYYKTMENYLDYRNGAQLMMNARLERDVVGTEGRAYGVEMMIRRTEGKLNGWASYTFSRTELRQSDPRIVLPVNSGGWYPADFDKPHEVKVIGNYRFTHRISVSLNAEYATGRPITLPVAKYNYANGEFLYYSDRNRYRVPDYFRMDFSLNIEPSHHLTLLTHSMFSIGVYNLTGRKNAHSVYFKQENGEIQGYQLSIFGAPIPYVSYNIKF